MGISTLLVVEDNATQQYVVTQLLERFDYEVHVVASGEEAITAIGIMNYAAILMDVTLPGIDGLEATRRIRRIELESGRRTPIIALTAHSFDNVRDDCLASGMDDYLLKPFEPDELRKMLLRYVYDPDQPNLKTLRPIPDDLNIDVPAETVDTIWP